MAKSEDKLAVSQSIAIPGALRWIQLYLQVLGNEDRKSAPEAKNTIYKNTRSNV